MSLFLIALIALTLLGRVSSNLKGARHHSVAALPYLLFAKYCTCVVNTTLLSGLGDTSQPSTGGPHKATAILSRSRLCGQA